MVDVSTDENMIAGIWKFRSSVSHEELVELAKGWKELAPDWYVDLHVRGCGKDQYGIGFKYRHPGHFHMRQYIAHMSDVLRKRFGNGLLGWDISSPITIIS
jgi:hypothetical protein